MSGHWQQVPLADPPPARPSDPGAGRAEALRCWWSAPLGRPPRAGVLVLPEVFGVNGWVRSVADRLAAEGYGALAVPLFQHTAPGLELGYGPEDLPLGRSHKERTSADQLLADIGAAAAWLQHRCGGRPLGCVGFCFGGHVAWLAATLPAVAATVSCYGAGVVGGRPGGGPPTLAVLPAISGHLLCLYGRRDPLIPPADVAAVAAALAATPERHRLLQLDAGHGFLCDQRADFNPEAARLGWQELLGWFDGHLRAAGLP
ncbi:MAG: dienelactone hydrolase family protein [Prochlorococcaceae cyanobacterium]